MLRVIFMFIIISFWAYGGRSLIGKDMLERKLWLKKIESQKCAYGVCPDK